MKNVSLEICEGEFLALAGANGSGKTTLIKHFNSLLKPTQGSVIVCGKNTQDHNIYELGCDVGFVFQNPDHQIFSESVYDEVAFGLKLRGLPRGEIESRVAESLSSVGLGGHEKDDPFLMSKGDRQRIAVASILSTRPRVIILDEPTTGLDYQGQRKMMELIKNLNSRGHTIVMVTHSMWVIAEYAHKMAIMQNGEMVINGYTRDVFGNATGLKKYALQSPHIVEISNYYNKTLLSVEEMLYCTERTYSGCL